MIDIDAGQIIAKAIGHATPLFIVGGKKVEVKGK